MKQTLSKLLETIGEEIHDTSFVDIHGTMRPITKDEQLAREIWKRALGYEKEMTNDDGSVTHRIFDPDPKMQQFLIERREGKFVAPSDKESISLLEKISELAKNQINDIAKQVTDEKSSEKMQ